MEKERFYDVILFVGFLRGGRVVMTSLTGLNTEMCHTVVGWLVSFCNQKVSEVRTRVLRSIHLIVYLMVNLDAQWDNTGLAVCVVCVVWFLHVCVWLFSV